MDSVENKLDKLGLYLPDSPSPLANYVPVVNTAVGLVYTSGQIPKRSDGSLRDLRLSGRRYDQSNGGALQQCAFCSVLSTAYYLQCPIYSEQKAG